MKLRGIDFEPILDAAGAEGFFREGYLHHKIFKPFGCNFKGCTFVAKTTTLKANKGNMPMKKDGITPKEILPKCIMPNFHPGGITLSLKMFYQGIMLNAVGLSGPGAEALFETGRWQKMTDPFWVSFMSIAPTPEERIFETEMFVKLFAKYLPEFRAPVGLQMDDSCPNVGLDPSCLINEAKTNLKIASVLGIPLMEKINALTQICAAREISRDHHCDALCVSNTVHWNDLPKVGIDRKKLFGTDISPLAEFGGGGMSGRPLFPLVVEWVRKARACGIKKPINAGGGIFSPNDLIRLHYAGADSAFIGSVATLRSWRVAKIIEKAYQLF